MEFARVSARQLVDNVGSERRFGGKLRRDLGGREKLAISSFKPSKQHENWWRVIIQMNALDPPVEVKDCVKKWTDTDGFKRLPPGAEYSYIDGWGVRVTYSSGNNDEDKMAFIYMADAGCRNATDGSNLILLSGKKTSSACKHLTIRHQLESPKTAKEAGAKRKHDADIERLHASNLYNHNQVRLNLLLETLRIINNNLPLAIVEYKESRLKEALMLKKEAHSKLTTERVNECVIELYSST